MFVCDICDYTTALNSNYHKHCRTKKHSQKVQQDNDRQLEIKLEQKRSCDLCKKRFSVKSNLVRHMIAKHPESSKLLLEQRVMKKHIKVINANGSKGSTKTYPNLPTIGFRCRYCNTELKTNYGKTKHEKSCSSNEIESYKAELKKKDEQINMLLEDKRNLTELSIQSSKTNSKALSALNYIVYHYTETNALEHIDETKLKQIVYAKEEEDVHIARIFMMYHRAKSLHKHIGDAIVDVYKKENPQSQSFHTTDVSRLNYVVMTAIGNKKEWIQDKGGIKVSDKVIDPIMDKIKELVDDFIDDIKNDREEIGAQDHKAIFDIQGDIEDGKLQKQIHKYIAPHFNNFSDDKKKKPIRKYTKKAKKMKDMILSEDD
jgi:hypothetical protein